MMDRDFIHHQCDKCGFVFDSDVIPSPFATECPCGGQYQPVDPSDTPHRDEWPDWVQIATREDWDDFVADELYKARNTIKVCEAANRIWAERFVEERRERRER